MGLHRKDSITVQWNLTTYSNGYPGVLKTEILHLLHKSSFRSFFKLFIIIGLLLIKTFPIHSNDFYQPWIRINQPTSYVRAERGVRVPKADSLPHKS